MDRHDLLQRLLNNFSLQEFQNLLAKGRTLVVDALWEGAKSLLIAAAYKASQKHLLIITTSEDRLHEDLPLFCAAPILSFPAWESLPEEEVPPSPDTVGARYQLLAQLLENKQPHIILTSLQALLQLLLPQERLHALFMTIHVGDTLYFDEFQEKLLAMGYQRQPMATDKGEFAVRGGLIDIFPVNSLTPYRLEFLGDEIASLRTYDPIAQTSVQKLATLTISPGQEIELLAAESQLSSLLDYLGSETLILFDDLLSIEDRAVILGSFGPSTHKALLSFPELWRKMETFQKLYFTENSLEELSELHAQRGEVLFEALQQKLQAQRWHSPLTPLPEHVGDDLLLALLQFPPATEIFFLTSNDSEYQSLKRKVTELELPQPLHFLQGYLSSGFHLQEEGILLLPHAELTGRYKVHRQKQRTHYQSLPTEVFSIQSGETVVHQNSGIGRYLGIEKRPNHLGIETEFLVLEYAEGAKLFVSIDQSHLVSKYLGATETTPEFHTLGSQRWKRAREKSEQAIKGYAVELLKLQAERELTQGFRYPPESEMVLQFGQDFPYEETPDQRSAIQAIYGDMVSEKLMDRLLCGDVGFGKTEVAMRAAFKAVVDGGKQVAVLVPTTVLALQHYETFSARMEDYPVSLGILSRFTPRKQLLDYLDKTSQGKIDILVGTHRLISSDVHFKDLGLVIIDEEQRFGVKVKEALKQLKKNVDCLTLSATPIPRTLYLSLVGARHLSIIHTPPADRLPIQTIICQKSDQVIKNALLRELARSGQAYFVHNRVETIYSVADHLRGLVPEARIVVGHGQMSASELDQVFHAFKKGDADILVATSIIENGIDIPTANTILVDKADHFGLADLYQIRGRVGRWNRKAYCYFLVDKSRELSSLSRKRLSVLTSLPGQGGGMKIAMHDLELRGAGNLLGTEQSGHITSIGFHLYCKLLKKAIYKLKNRESSLIDLSEVKLEFPFDARLPEHYINELSLRLELYARLGEVVSFEEIEALFKEIEDRFGALPPEAKWLHIFSRLRLFASRNQFTKILMGRHQIEIHQTHPKQGALVKKMRFTAPPQPKDLEKALLDLLQQQFSLRSRL